MSCRFSLLSAVLVFTTSAYAQVSNDSLLTFVRKEFDREVSGFKTATVPPYFMDYRFTDVTGETLQSSFGSLIADNRVHRRNFVPEVRIGSYKFDNTHVAENRGGEDERGGGRFVASLPVDNSEKAIAFSVWESTQGAYRHALSQYKLLLNDRKDSASTQSDFSKENAVTYHDAPVVAFKDFFNPKEWDERIKKLTAPFVTVPDIISADASIDVGTERKYYLSTEGSEIAENRTFAYVSLRATIRATDGDVVPLVKTWFARTPAELPTEAMFQESVIEMVDKLKKLKTAPLADPYTGPAILHAHAAGVFFHEIFGHRIEGERMKSNRDGQTFKSRVNQQVLPTTLNVSADPSLETMNGQALNGHYLYDDQGVKGERVALVQKGVLKTFLLSRSPLEGFSKSNGHGRGNLGAHPVSRQSNLIVENDKKVPTAQLRKMLISECQKEKKAYGYLIADVIGGFTTTGRDMPNAFNIFPTEVYRVYVDRRPDELVRGVDLIGTPLAMFAGITAADSNNEVFTGFCGAESGSIPVTAIAPTFFVKRIETQKKSVVNTDAPILPRPH